jgi:hypothetical protein
MLWLDTPAICRFKVVTRLVIVSRALLETISFLELPFEAKVEAVL